jgi:hypothetical protein
MTDLKKAAQQALEALEAMQSYAATEVKLKEKNHE